MLLVMEEDLKLRTIMTPMPRYVEADDPVSEVEQIFEEHSFRHLPVLMGEQVVGIISDRDVALAMSLSAEAVSEGELKAADICTHHPYIAEVDEDFATVLLKMAETKIGSVVILEHGKMVGILTTTDICRVCGLFFKNYANLR